jgi:hypothetical protein
VSTANLQCSNHGRRLRAGDAHPLLPGTDGLGPGTLRPQRPFGHNTLSGKHQTPCDLGLCKILPDAKIAALGLLQSERLVRGVLSFVFLQSFDRRNAPNRALPPIFSSAVTGGCLVSQFLSHPCGAPSLKERGRHACSHPFFSPLERRGPRRRRGKRGPSTIKENPHAQYHPYTDKSCRPLETISLVALFA